MKIDTTLRQWCKTCFAATVTRSCIYPPDDCCTGCCTPGNRPCEVEDGTDLWPDLDDDDRRLLIIADELAARRARKSGTDIYGNTYPPAGGWPSTSGG